VAWEGRTEERKRGSSIHLPGVAVVAVVVLIVHHLAEVMKEGRKD
jgi:hypothetical protein